MDFHFNNNCRKKHRWNSRIRNDNRQIDSNKMLSKLSPTRKWTRAFPIKRTEFWLSTSASFKINFFGSKTTLIDLGIETKLKRLLLSSWKLSECMFSHVFRSQCCSEPNPGHVKGYTRDKTGTLETRKENTFVCSFVLLNCRPNFSQTEVQRGKSHLKYEGLKCKCSYKFLVFSDQTPFVSVLIWIDK